MLLFVSVLIVAMEHQLTLFAFLLGRPSHQIHDTLLIETLSLGILDLLCQFLPIDDVFNIVGYQQLVLLFVAFGVVL